MMTHAAITHGRETLCVHQTQTVPRGSNGGGVTHAAHTSIVRCVKQPPPPPNRPDSMSHSVMTKHSNKQRKLRDDESIVIVLL